MVVNKQEQKFWEYHDRNPEVFKQFTRFALQMKASGRTRYSARTIIHLIRWNTDLKTASDDGFKINNNHSPYYALLLEDIFPSMDGFFSHRKGLRLTYQRSML